MSEAYLQLLVSAMCMMFACGIFVGLFWRVLVRIERDGDTRRFPRPGTHLERPEGFKPFRRHPDMLKPPEE